MAPEESTIEGFERLALALACAERSRKTIKKKTIARGITVDESQSALKMPEPKSHCRYMCTTKLA